MSNERKNQGQVTLEQGDGERWVTFEGKRLPAYEINDRVYFLDAIPVELLERDEEAQPREYDEYAARKIADSISRKVLMQPILTRYDPEKGKFLITEGQHRWRALKDILGEERVPAIIYLSLDKHVALQCGLEANAEDRARALSGGDIVRKTHAIMEVYARLLATERPDRPVTEVAILERYGRTTRATQRKFIIGKLAEDILETEGAKIAEYVSDRQTRKKPITAKNFMLFLGYIARSSAIDAPWDSEENLREDEFVNVLRITDLVADELLENGNWDPQQPDSPRHAHAVNVCRYHPFQALAYAIAKVVDVHGGGDATVGACYARTDSLDWEKIENEVRRILQDPIWDQDWVYNMRSQEDLRDVLSKEGIL